jgi:hypothetical protein
MDKNMHKLCIGRHERNIECDGVMVSTSSSFTKTKGIRSVCGYLGTEGKRNKIGEELVFWCE